MRVTKVSVMLGSDWRDHLAQGVDVVGVVAHDVAALVLVKEADRQVLHVAEEALAELLERALRDDGHRPRPGEVEDERHRVDADERGHEHADLSGDGLPVARLPVRGHDLERALHERGGQGREHGGDHDAADDERKQARVEREERLHEAPERAAATPAPRRLGPAAAGDVLALGLALGLGRLVRIRSR